MSAVSRNSHLPNDLGHQMLKFVTGKEAGRIARVSRNWAAFTIDSTLWRLYLQREFNLSATSNHRKFYVDEYCDRFLRSKIIGMSLVCICPNQANAETDPYGKFKVKYVIV